MLKKVYNAIKEYIDSNYSFVLVLSILILTFHNIDGVVTGGMGTLLSLAFVAAFLYAIHLNDKFVRFRALNKDPNNWEV